MEFAHLAFEVDHDLGGRGDLLETKLFLASQIFVQNLEKQLGDEIFDVLLVLLLSVDSLDVHAGDVILVFLAHLVHPTDQVIPLIRQIGQLIVESDLVLPVVDLLRTQLLKLMIKITDATIRLVVIGLKPFQIVRFAQQI